MSISTDEEAATPFRTTTEDTGNVGKDGHNGDATWSRFYAKYYSPVEWFVSANFPGRVNDIPDAFQRVAARIALNPAITNHDFRDRFRTVIIKLVRSELDHMHPKQRQRAERRFLSQPFHVLAALLHPAHDKGDLAKRKLEDIIASVREELLDPNFGNAKYLAQLNERYLRMWRLVQMSDTGNMAEIARRLGRQRYEVERPWKAIETWIGDEAKRIARATGYLD